MAEAPDLQSGPYPYRSTNPYLFERMMGIEPTEFCLASKCPTLWLHPHVFIEPLLGIAPRLSVYETDVLLLYYRGFSHGATESNCILKFWRLLGYHSLRRILKTRKAGIPFRARPSSDPGGRSSRGRVVSNRSVAPPGGIDRHGMGGAMPRRYSAWLDTSRLPVKNS